MQNLKAIDDKIRLSENLRSIVTTMKAHASANMVQFEHAARASNKYREVLDMALYVVLLKDDEKLSIQEISKGRTIHIVLGSDFGLAGRFNERMAEFAIEKISKNSDDYIIIIGKQLLGKLETDFNIEEYFAVPQTEDAIVLAVQRLLMKIDQLKEQSVINKILLYYCKLTESSILTEEIEILFPINPQDFSKISFDWNSRSIPMYLMDKGTLISDIMNQYYFLTLYRSLCFSLISENTSRISSMDSAKKNIDEKLQELKYLYRKNRQEEITNDLMYRPSRKTEGDV
ncbi:MAG: F0F1 ATP synthase subunit gamma [Proteocatella sp.]